MRRGIVRGLGLGHGLAVRRVALPHLAGENVIRAQVLCLGRIESTAELEHEPGGVPGLLACAELRLRWQRGTRSSQIRRSYLSDTTKPTMSRKIENPTRPGEVVEARVAESPERDFGHLFRRCRRLDARCTTGEFGGCSVYSVDEAVQVDRVEHAEGCRPRPVRQGGRGCFRPRLPARRRRDGSFRMFAERRPAAGSG